LFAPGKKKNEGAQEKVPSFKGEAEIHLKKNLNKQRPAIQGEPIIVKGKKKGSLVSPSWGFPHHWDFGHLSKKRGLRKYEETIRDVRNATAEVRILPVLDTPRPKLGGDRRLKRGKNRRERKMEVLARIGST